MSGLRTWARVVVIRAGTFVLPHLCVRPRRAAVLALACTAMVAGCGGKSFTPSTAVVDFPSGQPGKGKPAVTLGTKNFTEELILGQLYTQALQAKGYTVHLKANIGPTETVEPELLAGHIDAYPEYTGVIVSTLANINLGTGGAVASGPSPPNSAKSAYQQAARFEDSRGFTLLQPSPFQDVERVVALPAFAQAHGLRTLSDLKKLKSFTNGAPPENQTRYQGVVGMRQAYGLDNVKLVPYVIGQQYQALDSHRVDTIAVFSTDGQLLARPYAVLTDPKNLFGYQQVAPVVRKKVLKREGPAFAQTLDAVTSRLTTPLMQRMNAEVVLRHRSPAAVAHDFLATRLLT